MYVCMAIVSFFFNICMSYDEITSILNVFQLLKCFFHDPLSVQGPSMSVTVQAWPPRICPPVHHQAASSLLLCNLELT